MKPRISVEEFVQMQNVLKSRNSDYGRYLEILLKNYEQVADSELGKNVIRLNSRVELWHDILRKKVKFQIVLPKDANLRKRKLSVFSPVCLAILGREKGEQVETNRSGIKKTYRVIDVRN